MTNLHDSKSRYDLFFPFESSLSQESVSPFLMTLSRASFIGSSPPAISIANPAASFSVKEKSKNFGCIVSLVIGSFNANHNRSEREVLTEIIFAKCVLPASIFPSLGLSDNPPGRTIVHLNAVRFTRFLSASYFQCMYAGMNFRILPERAISSSFYG